LSLDRFDSSDTQPPPATTRSKKILWCCLFKKVSDDEVLEGGQQGGNLHSWAAELKLLIPVSKVHLGSGLIWLYYVNLQKNIELSWGGGPTPGYSRDQWTNNGCRNSTECSCCLYEVVVVLQDAWQGPCLTQLDKNKQSLSREHTSESIIHLTTRALCSTEAIRVGVDTKWRCTVFSKYDYCFLLIFVIIAIIAIFFRLGFWTRARASSSIGVSV
jgi:hypothetical protein